MYELVVRQQWNSMFTLSIFRVDANNNFFYVHSFCPRLRLLEVLKSLVCFLTLFPLINCSSVRLVFSLTQVSNCLDLQSQLDVSFFWLQPGKVLIVEGVLEELSLGQMVGRQGEQSPCCLANRDTHTDAFTYGTPTQETLEQRFVIVFHFDGGVLLLLEISLVSLLLSSSESVRLRVQQTPLMMVTGRSSFSNCPQAIYEELLSNQPSNFACSFRQLL